MAALGAMEQRYRRWLESARQEGASGASFLLWGDVELIYGRAGARALDSERGLLEYVLAFANEEADHSNVEKYLQGGRQMKRPCGRALNPLYLVIERETGTRPSARGAREAFLQLQAEKRRSLLQLLADVASDRKATRSRVAPEAQSLMRRLGVLPQVDDRMVLSYCPVLTDAASFQAFISVLLLDDERGEAKRGRGVLSFGSDLHRCQLNICNRWFLVNRDSAGGRPNTRYCGRVERIGREALPHYLVAHARRKR